MNRDIGYVAGIDIADSGILRWGWVFDDREE